MAERLSVDVPLATVFSEPDDFSGPSNQLLYGETTETLEEHGDEWLKVKSLHDEYEGWVYKTDLKTHSQKTHKIISLMTHLYAEPNYKTPPTYPLYGLSQITATEERKNGFVRLENGLWAFERDLAPLDYQEDDFVDIALKFIGTPYVWGGRSVNGIDCSGLVQISLMSTGINCPRDSKDQMKTTGKETADIERGALVYFEGHVGIMLDETQILNATARTMCVQTETLESVQKHYGDPLAIKSILR